VEDLSGLFTKWGRVIFSDLICKGKIARPGWQGRIIKARSDQTGRIGKIGQRKQRIK